MCCWCDQILKGAHAVVVYVRIVTWRRYLWVIPTYAQMRSCVTLAMFNMNYKAHQTHHGIPRASAQTESIITNAKTANTVVVSL